MKFVKIYNNLLLDGECFYKHDNRTLSEINDCINIFKITNRLPDPFWNNISSFHATNYSSFYSLTKRFIDEEYPNTVIKIKPSLSFLEWIYNNINYES